MDAIIVTANKRDATTVLKAPTSIQAISGESLQKQGVSGFMDVAGKIPGLAVQDLGPGDRKYVIRGISSTGASTTGVYYDEAVISGSNANDGGGFQSDIRLYDLDRVEVLRGPQGTLYGAGSMSGTIRFITRKPDLNSFGGYVTGEVSTTHRGGSNYDANGAINLPVLPGMAALRVVGWGIDDSGYVDQIRVGAGTANPLGLKRNINNDKVLGGRATLRVEPIADLTIDASYTRQHASTNGSSRYTPQGVTAFPLPGTPIVQGCDLCNTDVGVSPRKDDLTVYSLTASYRMRYGTLTATTNQFNRHHDYNIDNTAILATFGLPIPAVAYETVDRKVNSSEIRFASAFDFPVNFVVGGFRQRETSDLDVALLTVNGEGRATGRFSPLNSQDALLNPGVGSTFFGRTDHRSSTQYAAFGEATWNATSKLKFIGGVRYFTETLNGVQQVTHPFGGFNPGQVSLDPVVDEEQTNKKVTVKANASYTFNDKLLVYATASQGFRSGGLNPPSPFEFIPPSFGPDSLWNYEVGAKGRLFGRALEYQVDAFWIDWTDIQVQEVTKIAALHYIGNAGNAVSKGIEFEFTARPIEHLTANFAGSLQDAYLTKGATPEELAANPTRGVTGDKLPDVPRFQYALGLDYTAPLAGDWTGTLAADINYQGKRNAYFAANPFNIKLEPYTLINLRAAVSNGLWRGTLFVRNLTDKRAQVSAINSAQDPHALITVRPRTFGLTVTRNF
jgi:outer membrane receptor protein involved in Fe transport